MQMPFNCVPVFFGLFRIFAGQWALGMERCVDLKPNGGRSVPEPWDLGTLTPFACSCSWDFNWRLTRLTTFIHIIQGDGFLNSALRVSCVLWLCLTFEVWGKQSSILDLEVVAPRMDTVQFEDSGVRTVLNFLCFHCLANGLAFLFLVTIKLANSFSLLSVSYSDRENSIPDMQVTRIWILSNLKVFVSVLGTPFFDLKKPRKLQVLTHLQKATHIHTRLHLHPTGKHTIKQIPSTQWCMVAPWYIEDHCRYK
jgi:hypothetical protein